MSFSSILNCFIQKLIFSLQFSFNEEKTSSPVSLLQFSFNRLPVPVTVLKRNRSGLWRHIKGTCRTLRWSCCKHSNNVAWHDRTQLSQHFCRATRVWCRVGVILWCEFAFISLQHMHFQFDYLCSGTTYDIIFRCCRLVFYKSCYEIAWFILFWCHKNVVTSLIKVHREIWPGLWCYILIRHSLWKAPTKTEPSNRTVWKPASDFRIV